jgi:hypothetical protein
MGLRPKHIYRRLNLARLDSNSLKIHRKEIYQLFQEMKEAHGKWLKGASPKKLAHLAQVFVDLLSGVFLVSKKTLSLVDRPRPHSRDSQGRLRRELHGECAFHGNIRVFLRTASRGQPTAFRTFFNTLVHEWVHHYDFEALGDTIHCAGFYQRVNTIYKSCLNSEQEAFERKSE